MTAATGTRSAKWHRIRPGHYRHVPTGHEAIQDTPNDTLWHVYDGGGHRVFSGPRLYSAKAWVRECAP